MSQVDVFEIEDDFDPLEDLRIDGEEEAPETDYLPPIPDAELSRVPKEIPLSAEERTEKLLKGIPGQKFRLLRAVKLCVEPQTFEAIDAKLEEVFPSSISVYDTAQLVQLLERAGALESEVEDAAQQDAQDEAATQQAATDYLVVTPQGSRRYAATAAGLAALDTYWGERVVRKVIEEEPQYLPLYRTILEMTSAENGCGTKELDAVIDVDPLCVEPRRFCGYFLDRLEEADAVQWKEAAWIITDLGREVLASHIFDN